MQREISNSVVTTYDNEIEINHPRAVTYREFWPSMLYPCQKMNSYGAMFLVVPKFCSPKFEMVEKLKSCYVAAPLGKMAATVSRALGRDPVRASKIKKVKLR